jgi:hypothetical protein
VRVPAPRVATLAGIVLFGIGGPSDVEWKRPENRQATASPPTYATKEGTVMSESSREAREEARRYVRRKRIFYTVLGIWIALSLMWFAIDMLEGGSGTWFYWPMLGTGIAVAITGIVLLGIGGPLGVEWERREVDKYLRRRGNEP